ncbi:MAG: PASTA domain-containing protein [Clostridia bacterium]|nr:PASTA domain-containing protein [Clostridia bacterium]
MKENMSSFIKKRSTIIVVAVILMWSVIVGRLFYYQVIHHKEYQQSVADQVQRTNTVSAERGEILDRNSVVLATNISVWRVFVSPVDIVDSTQASFIARHLSEILGVDYDTVLNRALRENRADETIKRNVEKDEADKVLAFIEENDLKKQIHLEATTKRYYPYDSLAANVIGFMGTDGGSYGLELQYDKHLKGTPGRYISAKNGLGMDMPFKYESYVEAENGYDVVTTIDMRVQQLLEKQLKLSYEESGSLGGVTGIVMDVNSGGILAMGQYPNYNLNTPGTLSEELVNVLNSTELIPETEEYKAKYNELLFSSWNNKAVSWLYEPGSTFKVITASMALEENLISPTETFTCVGYVRVPGYSQPVHCHKRTGHGTMVFSVGLQQSCNPTLVAIGQRIGSNRFYDYFTAYGYTDKTGIDLRGEASGLYVGRSGLNIVELSVYSFGQTFKTSPIQQITAISAVANGGYVVTPHILDKIVDSKGNVVESFETNVKRQVISNDTAAYLSTILEEGVSGNGGAKNAYVLGYKVAAKTGTSQKRDILDENGESYLFVGSCVAYAPADDPQIAVLIVCDEPQGTIYGSMVAAPYISNLLEEVLPYIGIESSYNEEEQKRAHVQVWDFTGYTVESAIMNARNLGLTYEFVGDGPEVVSQIPAGGSSVLMSSGKVIFFLGSAKPEDSQQITVPNVLGQTASIVNRTLTNAGFNIKIDGAMNFDEGVGAKAVAQSPAAGEVVPKGTVVTVEFRHTDGTD